MSRTGMPLLSGPAPPAQTQEQSCRKCNKEFNMLFARSRRCNHCGESIRGGTCLLVLNCATWMCLPGYSYCHSCSDYQALMPRSDNSGYDPMPVCAYCIESLNSKHTCFSCYSWNPVPGNIDERSVQSRLLGKANCVDFPWLSSRSTPKTTASTYTTLSRRTI